MRTLIENTLKDLMNFLISYSNGNYFKLEDNFRGLLVPHEIVPLIIPLRPNLETSSVYLEPNLDDLNIVLKDIVDQITNSLNNFPRVETLLFHNFIPNKPYYNMLKTDEELVFDYKSRLDKLIEANSYGQIQYQKTY